MFAFLFVFLSCLLESMTKYDLGNHFFAFAFFFFYLSTFHFFPVFALLSQFHIQREQRLQIETLVAACSL